MKAVPVGGERHREGEKRVMLEHVLPAEKQKINEEPGENENQSVSLCKLIDSKRSSFQFFPNIFPNYLLFQSDGLPS